MTTELNFLTDRSHDVLRGEPNPLDVIFRPRSIAVIGATEREGSVGRTVVENLVKGGFAGTLCGVNPHRREVLGVPTYPSLADAPGKVDLAVVVTPAATVPGVIRECGAAGAGGAVIISAGFKEIGAVGAQLEQDALTEARRGKVLLVGPNCLGVMNPFAKLNATFAQSMALEGSVALLSQSGALCTAILDWSLRENVGFSAFVSTGSMLDVGWGDLIDYFGDDPHTRSILLYMESIGNPRAFLSAAREVARAKPIIVIKAGRTAAAAKAAASHTGALTGSDDVLEAAFRRCGVLRVDRIAELFEMADVLGKQPRPRGRRLAIVTNAGGPGVLATDALLGAGGELAALSSATLEALNAQLPPHWSHGNPVDILGDADPSRFGDAVEIVLRDPGCDGLLAILAPQGMTDPARSAEQLAAHVKQAAIPVLASWMGGASVEQGVALLSRAGIPTFDYPDFAARVFTYLWQYSENLRALNETPVLPAAAETQLDRPRAAELVRAAADAGRTLLTEWESKQLLAAYGVPVVPTEILRDVEQAVAAAERIGYPVVIKLYSETITHKSDVGGVRLNLTTPEAVRAAFNEIRAALEQRGAAAAFAGVTVQPMIRREGYELILGSSPDPQFGPVLLFGAGGELVEVFRDNSLALPPLTTTLARRLMERTRIYRALQGVRGRKPVDLSALELLLVRFSQMVAEQRRIKEVDINPLLVSPEGCLALDARVVLYQAAIPDAELPALAIRPYPAQYVSSFTIRDGATIRIRPIRPEDEPKMVRFHEKLSEETVHMRYLQNLKLDRRVAHERLTRICFIDYDREMALVAETTGGSEEIVAVARFSKSHGRDDAEVAVLVRDDFQRRGIGVAILQRLVEAARQEKVARLVAFMVAENLGMQRIAAKAGFLLDRVSDPRMVVATKELAAT
jgi:acetyltransferase